MSKIMVLDYPMDSDTYKACQTREIPTDELPKHRMPKDFCFQDGSWNDQELPLSEQKRET